MISTSEVVQSIIQKSPLLEDGLARGIINYSALARDLRPQIEKKTYEINKTRSNRHGSKKGK